MSKDKKTGRFVATHGLSRHPHYDRLEPKRKAYLKAWKAKPEVKARAAARSKRNYNPKRSLAWYHARKEKLAGRSKPKTCDVCWQLGDKHGICFDHCHQTGKFRGWLCANCNKAIGFAKDNPEILRSLASYLER